MFKIIIKVALAILLFLCLLNMSYGYYQFVRFISMITFAIFGYYAIKEKKELPNPAVYTINSTLSFPVDETLLPIAKRSLVRYIS